MRRALAGCAILAGLSIAVAGGQARDGAGSSRPAVRGPFALVSLGSLGTVTWRCDAATGRYALGYRLAGRWATTAVTLRASGRAVRRVTVQPGEGTGFPFLADDVQRLVVVQGTGARTLRADVAADFAHPLATASSCFGYLPPALDVRMRPVR